MKKTVFLPCLALLALIGCTDTDTVEQTTSPPPPAAQGTPPTEETERQSMVIPPAAPEAPAPTGDMDQ